MELAGRFTMMIAHRPRGKRHCSRGLQRSRRTLKLHNDHAPTVVPRVNRGGGSVIINLNSQNEYSVLFFILIAQSSIAEENTIAINALLAFPRRSA